MCTHHDGARLEDGELHEKAHATWSRRQFLRGMALSGAAVSLGLNGRTVSATMANPLLRALASQASDRILVVIQLSGGNDGLNTVIPISNDIYHNARPNIRIQNAIALDNDTGLHPALTRLAPLYQDGKVEIIQNVGYASPELSHFVSTDVWLSGKDANVLENTGWSGRFLEHAYPTYEDDPPDHPVALQIGASTPLLFAGHDQSLGVTLPNQSLLDRLASSGKLFDEEDVPDSRVGREIAFVRRVSNDSFVYARAIKDAFDVGRNALRYSGGGTLGSDLATVARLIRGGLGARIYHVSIGGFDTHAYQAGSHNALLSRLGNSIADFVTDLSSDGLIDQVCGVTFSEFGRRLYQNGSSGTDHGTSAPMFVFGSQLQGGLLGQAPDLGNLDPARNLIASIDFRSVYGSLLRDWFGMAQVEVDQLFDGAYPIMNLFNGSLATDTGQIHELPEKVTLESVYPNPMQRDARVVMELDSAGPVALSLVDILGRPVMRQDLGVLQAGRQDVPISLPDNVATGTYILRVRHGQQSVTRPVQVVGY
ncbi:MAG: DUF1501 domain-containing protein [Bacteroidota bacterium]|nr:DUF1501 domain-containing protein [Bacteroidota bacterium]